MAGNGAVYISFREWGGEPEAEELDWTVEQLSVGLMGNGEVEVKAVAGIQLLPERACYGAKY